MQALKTGTCCAGASQSPRQQQQQQQPAGSACVAGSVAGCCSGCWRCGGDTAPLFAGLASAAGGSPLHLQVRVPRQFHCMTVMGPVTAEALCIFPSSSSTRHLPVESGRVCASGWGGPSGGAGAAGRAGGRGPSAGGRRYWRRLWRLGRPRSRPGAAAALRQRASQWAKGALAGVQPACCPQCAAIILIQHIATSICNPCALPMCHVFELQSVVGE